MRQYLPLACLRGSQSMISDCMRSRASRKSRGRRCRPTTVCAVSRLSNKQAATGILQRALLINCKPGTVGCATARRLYMRNFGANLKLSSIYTVNQKTHQNISSYLLQNPTYSDKIWIYTVSQKTATLTTARTLSIFDRFAKFFHCCKVR